MKLELYCTNDILEGPENRGFEPLRIMTSLARLRDEGGIESKVVDVSDWGQEALSQAYEHAVMASYTNGYAIRKVFGTNTSSASFFGKGVPALIVYDGEKPLHVFPHDERERGLVTIRDYLDSLVEGEDIQGARLAQAMDDLRRTIGPVGARTSELVREGRRR